MSGLNQHVNIEYHANQSESMDTILGHTVSGVSYKCIMVSAPPNSFAAKLLQTVSIYHKMAC